MARVQVSAASIRRAWARTDLTRAEQAALVGLPREAFRSRAAQLGLPTGQHGGNRRGVDADLLTRLWMAGVGLQEIAAHLGRRPNSVQLARRKLGLPPRPCGYVPQLTLAQFLEHLMGERLAEIARQEQRARREADLRDQHLMRERAA